MRPLAIDLFCGLGGWSDGLLAEGWDVIGFDIERHVYGEHRYPAQLVLQDVLTLHGSQFRNVDLIVASPPCQEYSWRAMPWKIAKALSPEEAGLPVPSWWHLPQSSPKLDKCMNPSQMEEWTEWRRKFPRPPPDKRLFNACFRIQREACEAAGRHIPMIVENVKGAQPWVGRARWSFGSFYLWGDVPALMPMTRRIAKNPGLNWSAHVELDYRTSGKGACFRDSAMKNNGGSWFNVAHNKESGKGQNPDGRPIKNGNDWFGSGEDCSLQRRAGSGSDKRKMASAMIAKIPLALSRHIAATFLPRAHSASSSERAA